MTQCPKLSFSGFLRVVCLSVAAVVFVAVVAAAQQSVVPNAPLNLVGANTESGVELGWAAPPPGGDPRISLIGPVTKYRVSRRTTEGSKFSIVGTVDADTLTYVDDTVMKGVKYAYFVKAVNLIGPSPASNRVEVNVTKYDAATEMQKLIRSLKSVVASLEDELAANQSPDCMATESGSGDVDDVVFNGCNVHVRNGEDDTDTVNGVGNLIIGYNAEPDSSLLGPDYNGERTGSHNVVVGDEHSWTGSSGIVSGFGGILWADDAAIIGSRRIKVSGVGSVAVGSQSGHVSGDYSTVVNTYGSDVNGDYSSVIGGRLSTIRQNGVGSVLAAPGQTNTRWRIPVSGRQQLGFVRAFGPSEALRV